MTIHDIARKSVGSLPVRGAWVEIRRRVEEDVPPFVSLPVRGAWVEIFCTAAIASARAVAPRAGSVG